MLTLFSLVAILLRLLLQVLKKICLDQYFGLKQIKMVVNASKFQVILFGLNSNENIVLEVNGCSVDVVSSVTLLGVKFDSKLRYYQRVLKICEKTNTKITAFSRVSNYDDEKQSLIFYNSFITSQFNYCS